MAHLEPEKATFEEKLLNALLDCYFWNNFRINGDLKLGQVAYFQKCLLLVTWGQFRSSLDLILLEMGIKMVFQHYMNVFIFIIEYWNIRRHEMIISKGLFFLKKWGTKYKPGQSSLRLDTYLNLRTIIYLILLLMFLYFLLYSIY